MVSYHPYQFQWLSPPVVVYSLSLPVYWLPRDGHRSDPSFHPVSSVPPPPRVLRIFFISHLDDKFPLHHLFLLHPFVVCGTQGSDCVGIEQMTSTSLPPHMSRTCSAALRKRHPHAIQKISSLSASSSVSIIKGTFPPQFPYGC